MAGGATFLYNRFSGPVAQSVEQRIENTTFGCIDRLKPIS